MWNVRNGSIALDCADTRALGAFWAGLFEGEVAFSNEEFVAVKVNQIWLTAVRVADYRAPTWPEGDLPKQMHLDIAVDDLAAAEKKAVMLGARRAQVQPAPDRYIVLNDPAGHPFCLSTQIPG
jgi:hypothetical protein